jgi:uncharacterized protein DUF4242
MRRYVIEREMPGAGSLSTQAIAEASNGVLKEMGNDIQWEQSYQTADKVYCVYLAKDEQTVREHARRGGFPATKVTEVQEVFDRMTEFTQKG